MVIELNRMDEMDFLTMSISDKLDEIDVDVLDILNDDPYFTYDNIDQDPSEDKNYDVKAEIIEQLSLLHFADLSTLIGGLPLHKSMLVVSILGEDFPAHTLAETTSGIRDAILKNVGLKRFSLLLAELDIDDAVMVLEDLSETEQHEIINLLPQEQRDLLEHVFAVYEDDTAGRMMEWNYVSLNENWTVADALKFTRENRKSLPMLFYDYFIVDLDNKPLGYIPISTLVRSSPKLKLKKIMNPNYVPIPADMDQEDVAALFSARNFVSAAVIDSNGSIIGSITIDDVVDVIQEENEQDLMHMGGLSDSDFHKNLTQTVLKRFMWLAINLFATFLSAGIITLFSNTVAHIVILASLMPIITSLCGSSGTQGLTVLIRSIATNELTPANRKSAFIKEFSVGVVNGVIFGFLASIGSYILYHNLGVSIVLGSAMLANLFIAGTLGYVVPIVLNALKIDPAVASGVILTTLTDICGFFIFLSLATACLL